MVSAAWGSFKLCEPLDYHDGTIELELSLTLVGSVPKYYPITASYSPK